MSTISRAIIKSYDVATHTATVQIAGSLAVWLDAVPVSDAISPADVVAGRECGVIFFTDDNPTDAAVVTVHNALPVGSHRLRDQDGDTYIDVERTANENKLAGYVGGTLRWLVQTSTPHHDLTGDVKVSGATGLGVSVSTIVRLNVGTWPSLGSAASKLIQVVLTGVQTANATGGGVYKAGFDFLGKYDIDGYNLNDFYGARFAPEVGNTGTGPNAGNVSYHASAARAVVGSTPLGFDYGAGVGAVDMDAFTVESPVDNSSQTSTLTALRGIRIEDQAFTQADASVIGKGLVIEAQGGTRTLDIAGTTAPSVHQPSLQLFGATTSFGGGVGVLGITYAGTNPTSNPSGGVVMWASSATGNTRFRGTGGQVCSLPTGGAGNVTGSRGGNAALASLLTALAGLGLIVDGTTA